MKKQSLLAQTLQDSIKLSGKSQKVVAEALGVSEQALSQWLHDGALIPPQHVKGIVDIARRFGGAKSVAAFYKMAGLPKRQVTPFYKSKKIEKNIGYYITKYYVDKLRERIRVATCTRTLRENEKLCNRLAKFVHSTF
jgi:transcriptional regulator with XRE-family HTH domain